MDSIQVKYNKHSPYIASLRHILCYPCVGIVAGARNPNSTEFHVQIETMAKKNVCSGQLLINRSPIYI